MDNEILIGNIKGERGPQGEKGDKGEKGDTGQGFKVIDYYETLDALVSAITNPSGGDAYGVGSGQPYDIYIYSPNNGWINNGPLQGAKGDKGDKGETGAQGERGAKGDKGDKGEDGADGTPATIMHASATVDNTTGTPQVTVEMGGTASTRSFTFNFSGLKGEKGDKGDKGDTGSNPVIDINEQTPTYDEASSLATLTSGEKISIAFGKIKKAITSLISHLGNTTIHLTSEERTAWNGKAPGTSGLGKTAISASTNVKDFMTRGCGFYSPGNATDSPHKSGDWMSLLQIARSMTAGAETGVQLAFRDFEPNYPRMWLRALLTGTVGDWVEMIHSGNIGNYIPNSPQVIVGSYVGTGTYISGGETDANIAAAQNTIQFPSFPRCVMIKRRAEKFWNIIAPNPDDNKLSFRTYGGNDYAGGLCSGKITSDNKMTWYAHVQKWGYSADLNTGNVSIKLETIASDSYATLKPIYQLNWEGNTYDYIAICD